MASRLVDDAYRANFWSRVQVSCKVFKREMNLFSVHSHSEILRVKLSLERLSKRFLSLREGHAAAYGPGEWKLFAGKGDRIQDEE